jgi:hypothetical protein
MHPADVPFLMLARLHDGLQEVLARVHTPAYDTRLGGKYEFFPPDPAVLYAALAVATAYVLVNAYAPCVVYAVARRRGVAASES